MIDPDTAGALLTFGLLMLLALAAIVANRGAAENLSETRIEPQNILKGDRNE